MVHCDYYIDSSTRPYSVCLPEISDFSAVYFGIVVKLANLPVCEPVSLTAKGAHHQKIA